MVLITRPPRTSSASASASAKSHHLPPSADPLTPLHNLRPPSPQTNNNRRTSEDSVRSATTSNSSFQEDSDDSVTYSHQSDNNHQNTSALDPTAHHPRTSQRSLPDGPPRLSLSTTHSSRNQGNTFSSPSSSHQQLPSTDAKQHDVERLPTYDDLAAAEPGNARFGRWKGWIEKRARERNEERAEARKEGRQPRRSWNLDDHDNHHGGGAQGTESEDDDHRARARDQSAEWRLSQQPFSGARAVPGALGVTNPDVDPVSPTMEDEGNLSSPAPSSANSLLKGGYGKLPLTVSSNVHPVGSRFFRQVAEKPRCGIVLPVGKGGCDRFILIGTDDGLYITDLLPSLGSAPLKTATSSSDAVVVPLWKGLGVLQLQVHIEETSIPQQKRQDGPRGVVIALVTSPGCTPELRMWSLTSLTNLAKWRCFNETSEPVVMPPLHPMPVKGAGASSEAKRSSRAFIKSLFASSETQAKDKGKGKSREVESSSSPIDSDYVVVSTSRFPSTTSQDHAQKPSNATDFPRERQRTESDVSSASQSTTLASTSSRTNLVLASAPPTPVASSNSTPSSESTAKPNDAACDKSSTTSLPFEWANSSIPLPLPKGHTTILFFTLTNVPARDPDPAAKGDEDTLKHWEKGHLLLAVATSRVIYLYESRPSERRTWVLSNEFYAPATPRFISMVNSPSSLPSSSRNNTRNSPSPLLSNVSLVLGTRHETVLIRMADLSVRGIEILSKTRSRRSGSHRSTGSTSTSASSTRAAVASRVAAFVESKQGLIPAGMRGEDYGLAIGRRRPDGGGEESESADGGGGREEWVGCDELILPTRRCARASEGHLCRRLYLLTQGSSTAVVRSPLGAVEKEGGNVVDGPLPHRGGGPPPLHLRPIHTFHWPEPVSKVVVIFPDSALKAGLETHLIHVNLVGFSRTGIHVQEGTISIPFVEQLAHPDRSPPLPASSPSTTHFIHNTTFFHPIRQHKLPPLAKEAMPADVDPELDDTASLDFGRETAFLCASIGGEWGRGASSASPATSPVMGDSDDENDGGPTPVQPGKPAGLFFFTKAHADFPLKFLG